MSLSQQAESALRAAAERQGAIDSDVVLLFQDLTQNLDGPDLENSAREAVRKMADAKPSLFKPRDFAKMSPEEQAAVDARLRKAEHPTVPKGEFHGLDSARLRGDELDALHRHIGGRRNSYDTSILKSALARQRIQDGAMS